MPDQERWWEILPMKDTRLAKSRLGGDPGARRRLAIEMARDTLSAVVGASCVEGVLTVCQREDDAESLALPGVTVVVRPGLSLNEAVLAGADLVRDGDPSRNLAVLPGDLPYRPRVSATRTTSPPARWSAAWTRRRRWTSCWA